MAHSRKAWTTEQYMDWINEHRPGWTLGEEYNGAAARIYHNCPEGHSIDVTPNVFKGGKQCDQCKTLDRLDREEAKREGREVPPPKRNKRPEELHIVLGDEYQSAIEARNKFRSELIKCLESATLAEMNMEIAQDAAINFAVAEAKMDLIQKIKLKK